MRARALAAPLLLLAAFAALALAPFIVSGWILFLLTVAGGKALAVLGIVLLLRGKLLTFGHALYYAAGAYAAGLSVKYFGLHDGIALIFSGLLAGIAVSALLGLLVTRYRGVYFALLNLAFSMVLFGILLKFYDVTGGTDGLGLPVPSFGPFTVRGASLRTAMYELTLVLTAGLVYLAHRFVHSPRGYALRAIRDNEVRVEYMGISVRGTVYIAYVLAGGLAGIAGVLIGLSVGHITPDLAFWSQSGEFVFVAILGGIGSVFAPVVGSVLFEFVRNYAFQLSPYTWQMTLGAALLLIIFFLPGGVWSLGAVVQKWRRR
jgi:branched-chain amino acid transport system permease protein